MDEYTVLAAFLTGVLAQALQIARSRRGMLGVVCLAVLAFGGTVLLVGKSADWRFDVPVLSGLLFVVAFAAFFRDRILPHVSVRALLHLSLLFYYTLTLELGPLRPPLWLVILLGVPAVWLLILAARAGAPGRANRLFMYIWFLLVMIWLVPRQWSMDRLQAIFLDSGFSWMLLAYSFTAGAVALVFAAHVLYLLMLIPVPRRRHIVLRILEGPRDPADDFVRAHRAALIGKVGTRVARSSRAYLLVTLHAALLALNFRLQLVAPELLVNVSIAVVYWTLLSPARTMAEQGHRKNEPLPADTSGKQPRSA